MKLSARVIDGATLFGVGLACYALKASLAYKPLTIYVMGLIGIILMLLGLWALLTK